MVSVSATRLKVAIAVGGFWVLVGCATQAPRSSVILETPAQTRIESMAVVDVVVAAGEGMVVVNRQPVGLAPQRLELPVTPQGFLRTPVSVGVRFVARHVGESSFSLEEVLEVTDRPPVQLIFSRDEKQARRVFGHRR